MWKELGDLIIECDRERSRVKWLVAATEYPEHIIVAALKHGAHVKEIVYTEDGFWTMVAD